MLCIAWAKFTAAPGSEDRLAAVLKDMAGSSREENGCVAYDVFRVRDSSDFRLFEIFEDEAALSFHRETAHYATFRDAVAELLEQPIGVTRLEAVDWLSIARPQPKSAQSARS